MVRHSFQMPWTMFVSVLWLLLDLGRSFKTVLIHFTFVYLLYVLLIRLMEKKNYARVNHYL